MVELRAKIEEIDRRLENENDSTYREQKTEVEDQVQMLLEEARVREEEVNELQVCSLTSHLFGKHRKLSLSFQLSSHNRLVFVFVLRKFTFSQSTARLAEKNGQTLFVL